MSALAITHMPETKQTQITIPIEELRVNDIILDGVGILEPVTVNKIFDPEHEVDIRVITLVNGRNSLYYREYSAEMEIVIQDHVDNMIVMLKDTFDPEEGSDW